MNVIKAIMFAGGSVGGLIGFAGGAGQAFKNVLENGMNRRLYNITDTEETYYLMKDTCQLVWRPVLYCGAGVLIGSTFPISIPVIYTEFKKYEDKKNKERYDSMIALLKSDI
jgi:hypothetical protein